MPDEYRKSADDRVFYVYPENWESLQLYLALQTQWFISPTGHRTGINYVSIHPVCRLMGIKMTRELFADLQLMELTQINLGYQ